MSVLKVKNGNQWDIVPAIKGDPGDPAADESITDEMLVTDGIKTEIEWLWGNQLMDSREGKLLHAEDAYTAPAVDISVDGKSTHVTTTGKNLLDESNNIVRGYFYDTNDKIEGGGTSIYAPVTEGATYTLSGGNGNRYVVAYTDVLPAVNAPLIAHASAQKTFTVPTGARYVVFYIDNGNTLTPSGYQLEAGASATSYEPYSGGKPSPNPDYPQNIESVDELVLTLAGKNLFPIADGNISGSGYSVRNAFNDITNQLTFADNSQYTVSMDVSASSTTGYFRLQYLYLDGTTTLGGWFSSSTTSMGLTSTAGKSIKSLSLANYNNGAQISLSNIQLELGSTATDYEPYLGNTASLLPDGYSLRSLPDGTKDELHLSYLRPSKRAGWAWYSRELVKRITQKTLDGSENWNMGSSTYDGNLGTDRFVNLTDSLNLGIRAPNSVLSPVLKSKNDYIWANPDVHLWSICRNAIQVHIVFDNETVGISSSEEESRTDKIKTWLSENPVTIYYPLATPTTETLDPIELPIMPSRTVNVWSDPATNLKMTYIQDSNLIIENLEATIADIATS